MLLSVAQIYHSIGIWFLIVYRSMIYTKCTDNMELGGKIALFKGYLYIMYDDRAITV